MKAVEIVRRRLVLAPDAFADMVVWRIPGGVPPSRHEFKYRLAYVVAATCVVRYDNERGKGDHCHWDDIELPYRFSTPIQLMQDFADDITRWNHENGRA